MNGDGGPPSSTTAASKKENSIAKDKANDESDSEESQEAELRIEAM